MSGKHKLLHTWMCGQYRLAEDLQRVLKHLQLESMGYVAPGTIQQMGDQGTADG